MERIKHEILSNKSNIENKNNILTQALTENDELQIKIDSLNKEIEK